MEHIEIDKLIQHLLSRKWRDLHVSLDSIENGQYPSVYLLAYSAKELEGKSIELGDIFYVGMSNSVDGVKSRIREFLRGIESGKCHSAAMRFFREYSRKGPYSDLKHRKKFYVVSISLLCNVKKSERSDSDLRTMGTIAKLEYDMLAHIKKACAQEPALNKR